MARIRTIKPEFWKHEDLSALPEITHMLAAALLGYADDEGYFNANPALVKSECLPLRESSVSTQDSLRQLVEIGYIQVGKGTDGKRYGRIVTFDDHQRVNRPTPSKIKAVGIVWEGSSSAHAGLTEPSPPEGKGREQEGKGTEESSLPAVDTTKAASQEATTGENVVDLSVSQDQRVVDIVLACYHELLPACRRVEALTPKRRKRILAANKLARDLCRQHGWSMTVREFWTAYFEECQEDAWLRGDVANPNNPKWKQNLYLLLDEDRFGQIMDQAVAKVRNPEAA